VPTLVGLKGREMNEITNFALCSAVGFGVGGAIGGTMWFESRLRQFGFAFLGAIGGAFLGFASNGWRKAVDCRWPGVRKSG